MWKFEKQKHTEPPSLAEALQFSDDELALNRDGQLSERQRDELFSVAHEIRSSELLIYLVAAFVAAVIILDGVRRGDTVSSRIAILGVLGAIVYLISAMIHRYMARYQLDADDTVAAIQGHVSLDIRQSSNNAIYMMNISGVEFNLSKEAFFAFKNGDPYALYYVPRTRRLLSAEWLRDT